MPTYMMSAEGDKNNLDYVTRQRLRAEDDSTTGLMILFIIAVFIVGMIVGSTLHDTMFHLIER